MTIADFLDQDYDYVSYRLTLDTWRDEYCKYPSLAIEHSVFAGCFEIKDGTIIPIDNDYYSSKEEVLSYETWSNDEVINGLTIIVRGEWI